MYIREYVCMYVYHLPARFFAFCCALLSIDLGEYVCVCIYVNMYVCMYVCRSPDSFFAFCCALLLIDLGLASSSELEESPPSTRSRFCTLSLRMFVCEYADMDLTLCMGA
jgi:hypothetical protein